MILPTHTYDHSIVNSSHLLFSSSLFLSFGAATVNQQMEKVHLVDIEFASNDKPK